VGVFGQRLFGAFGERGTGEKQGSKSFFFPYLTRLGKKKTHNDVQNGTVWGFVF
jgi:hypothetical protein